MIPDAISLPISAVAQQAALDRAAQAANPSRGREVFLQSLAIAVALDFWAWLDLGPAQAVINVLPGEVGRIALPQVGTIVLLPVEMTAPDITQDGLEGDREDGLVEYRLDQLDFGLEPLDLSSDVDLESGDLGDLDLRLESLNLSDGVALESDLSIELLDSGMDDDDLRLDDFRLEDLAGEFSSGSRFNGWQFNGYDEPFAASEGPALTNTSADDTEYEVIEDEAIEAGSPAITNLGDLFPIDLPIEIGRAHV